MTPLNEAFALQASGPGEWKAHAHPGYEAIHGMFGGWTAAILLKSILDDTRVQGTAAALTAHYLKPVSPRSEVNIQTRSVGGSRSLNFWEAKLSLADHEEPAALATIVLANRRTSDGFTDQFMPNVPDPETLPEFHPPAAFGERTLVRPVSGHPAFNQPNSRSIAWVRETSGRAVDFLQLAYLSDVYAPRIFMKSPGPRPSSTITMSVYFHASETELHDVGDDYILTEATGTRAELSTVGSQARLWSRNRGLLATTEQLCWFK